MLQHSVPQPRVGEVCLKGSGIEQILLTRT